MCVELGALLTVGGGIVKGASSLMSGFGTAGRDRDIASNDFYQAEFERIMANDRVGKAWDKAGQTIESQRGLYAGEGFTGSGSPSDVAYSTLTETGKDVYAIRLGATAKANNYDTEGRAYVSASNDAAMGGVLGAISPLIDAGSKVQKTRLGTSVFQR